MPQHSLIGPQAHADDLRSLIGFRGLWWVLILLGHRNSLFTHELHKNRSYFRSRNSAAVSAAMQLVAAESRNPR